MTELIRVEIMEGVLALTLNRPEKKNALTTDMYRALGEAIDAAADDPSVRCVLLQGAGDSFTAGNDIGNFAARSEAPSSPAAEGSKPFQNPLFTALARTPLPVVAAVQGRVVGVGVTMLLHCDMVLVAEDALLSTPFVNLALVPEFASSRLMPSRIGHLRAFQLFVLGEPIDGRTAVEWGLANAVLPRDELQPRALDAARRIAERPPSSVRATKALMRDPEPVQRQYDEEREAFAQQLRSSEAREAFAAFARRRTESQPRA